MCKSGLTVYAHVKIAEGERMKPASIFTGRSQLIFITLFVLAWLYSRSGVCSAAEPDQARSVHQVEVTVIHVDQYAVYAPNLVFYYDARMDRKKVASLMKTADQLRNRKALITYASADELGRDKHVLLQDIAPAEAGKSGPQKPSRESPNPEAQSAEPDNASRQAAVPEAPSPVTKAELTAFVRRVLEVNGKKDLAAAASLYADQVDYYDRGMVNRDYVLRDLRYYYRNWDELTTSLEGDVVMIVLDQPEVRIAKFISSYSVRNDRKSLEGRTENIWKVRKINGSLKLIDVKQRPLGKDSPG